MYCVDAAARPYLYGIGHTCDLFVSQGRPHIGTLNYKPLRSINDFDGYDTVVYWGDFLCNPMWGQLDYVGRRSSAGGVSDIQEWLTLYTGVKRARPDLTVVVAGGCALGSNSHLDNPEIRSSYLRFLAEADAIILRDPASLREVNQLGSPRHAVLGFDCATLMRPFKPANWRAPYFVYSFHRTLAPEQARQLVQAIEQHTGLIGIEVQWLSNRWPRKLFHLRLGGQLELAAHARFCVTDIYHLSVCAMTVGTPTYCVTQGESSVQSTLNEAKKHALFEMIGLPHMLLSWGELWRQDLPRVLDGWEPLARNHTQWSAGFQAAQQQFRHRLDQALLTPARAG